MNVRWDAVIDRSVMSAVDLVAKPPLRHAASRPGADHVKVHVTLFGALAALSTRQSVELALPAGVTVADVIATLGDRLGETFLSHVLDASGAKRRHCRLFVAGYPVEDLQTPLFPTIEPTEIDIILLIAPEGG